MSWVALVGTAASLAGLVGLIHCLVQAILLRKGTLTDEEVRQKLAKMLPVNLVSLAVAVMGLMAITIDLLII